LSLEWTRRRGYVRVFDEHSRTLGDYPYTPPQAPYSYQIFEEAGIFYAKNGKTGELEFPDEDATTVINNALSALTNGGRIFVRERICNISSQITIGDKIILEGFRGITTFKQTDDFTMIRNSDPSNGNSHITLKNIIFDFNLKNSVGKNPANSMLYFDAIKDSIFDNLEFKNIGAGSSAMA